MAKFRSTHNLNFERLFNDSFECSVFFRVGTCNGVYKINGNIVEISDIENSKKGNGHFEDVLEWMVERCKKSGMIGFAFVNIINQRFEKHLIEKRGFERTPINSDAVVKFIVP